MSNSTVSICARCGCEIDIVEYVNNTKMFIVLRQAMILHFCDYCICLLDEKRDDEQCPI